MEIKKIYYKSDFSITETNENGYTVPFRFRYYAATPSRYFEASYNGTTYKNCKLSDDGKSLTIPIDNHDLGCDILKVEREYYLTNEDFADKTCNEYIAPTAVVGTYTPEEKHEFTPTVRAQSPIYRSDESFSLSTGDKVIVKYTGTAKTTCDMYLFYRDNYTILASESDEFTFVADKDYDIVYPGELGQETSTYTIYRNETVEYNIRLAITGDDTINAYCTTPAYYQKGDPGDPGKDGTVVTVTPILEEGTHIADITTDDTTTHIYAPTGGATDADSVTYDSEKETHTSGSVGEELAQIVRELNDFDNAKANKTDIPTNTSDLNNDSGFVNSNYVKSTATGIINNYMGANNGVAALDSNAKIYSDELPDGTVIDSSYVHTDNNYDASAVAEVAKVEQLSLKVDEKQDAPTEAGTEGQVLSLDADGKPVWTDQSGDGVKTINGNAPDENGNIQVNVMTEEEIQRVEKAAEEILQLAEQVVVNISSNDGELDASGLVVSVMLEGMEEPEEVAVDSNQQAIFDVPKGMTFTVTYPTPVGYKALDDETFSATLNARTINKIYIASVDLEDVARSIVLEESSNPQWTLGCNANVIDNILNKYGSYVIDADNKKYARLDPTDHSKFLDGTAWSGAYGDAFRRFPKVYYLVQNNDAGQPVLYVSLRPIGTNSWDEAWIGTYKGNVLSNKLHSRPGVTATGNVTMSNFWTYAQNLGKDFGLVNYNDHCLLNALHLCKFGDANSEHSMGAGLQDSGSGYYNAKTGYTAALGDETGSMQYGDNAYKQNKLFGIEGLAGQQWEFRPNIRFDGVNAIVYKGNQVSNTIAEGDEDYVRTFQRDPNMNLTSSYVKTMRLGDYFDMIAIVGGGSASTYWCDGSWSSSSGQLLLVGGCSYYGSICGLSATNSNNAFSNANANIGARLSFRGDISEYELVDGATLAALHS